MRPLVACAVILAGCNQGFEPQYLVKDLRILAIRAEAEGTAFADPTPLDTVVLRALVANPLRRAGASVAWYGCLPTGDESLPPCADLAFLSNPARLATDPRVARLGACEPDPSGVCAITFALPDLTSALAYVLGTAAGDPSSSCGIYVELLIVAFAHADGKDDVALKRVRIVPTAEMLSAYGLAQSYVRNSNPQVQTVVRDRPVWGRCDGGIEVADPFPSGERILCAVPQSGSTQQYETCGPAGEGALTPEHPDWQWFVTAGEFPEFDGMTGNADRNEPRFIRPAGPFTLWTIVRDGRGGEGWLVRDLGPLP